MLFRIGAMPIKQDLSRGHVSVRHIIESFMLPGGGGGTPRKLGGGVRPASQNPYLIYEQNLRYPLSYL